MKGVILAGGNGTRMRPLTLACNKHLLPIGKKPMIQHCVDKMVEAGIQDVMVVTGGEHLGGIAEFLGSGKNFNCRVTYRVQEEAGGIAQALALAEDFVGDSCFADDSCCVLLGDNIFESSLKMCVEAFARQQHQGAMVVLKTVRDPQRFGVAKLRNGTVCKIVEKPKIPPSNLAVTGIYFYDSDVFDIIRLLKPSGRGELEITDVNNKYIEQGMMGYWTLKGWWTDAGTHESYQLANQLVLRSKQGV